MIASVEFPDPVDVQLVCRILSLIIEDTRQQSGKKLKIDNLDKLSHTIFEFGRNKSLTPPFSDLRSPNEIAEAVGVQKTLFDKKWTDVDEIGRTLALLIESRLVYQIELDQSQYFEPKKLLILPTGLLMYRKLSGRETILLEKFQEWVKECHQEHSLLALEAFKAGIENTIRNSQKLSSFNTSLSLYLLMYGAINSTHALRFDVDPTKSISGHQNIISGEITRIGQFVMGIDPMGGTQTLLDHFQTSNKIQRILPTSDYIKKSEDLPDNKTRYRIYFDLGTKSVDLPDTITQLDDLLRAIMIVARYRRSNAAEKILELLTEHTQKFNRLVDPIYTRTLFGHVPSVDYVLRIRGRAESVIKSLGEEEYSVDEDEDENDEEDLES